MATSPSTDGEVKKNGGNNLLLVKVEQAVTLPISQMKLYKTEDGTLLSRVKYAEKFYVSFNLPLL